MAWREGEATKSGVSQSQVVGDLKDVVVCRRMFMSALRACTLFYMKAIAFKCYSRQLPTYSFRFLHNIRDMACSSVKCL